jgi:hypothetical protein
MGAAPTLRKTAQAKSATGTTIRKKGMDVLSTEPNGHTNSSDRFDGLQPLKVSFGIR